MSFLGEIPGDEMLAIWNCDHNQKQNEMHCAAAATSTATTPRGHGDGACSAATQCLSVEIQKQWHSVQSGDDQEPSPRDAS